MAGFKCEDMRMECKFEASAKTEAELMAKIADHAAKAHNMESIPADMMEKVKKVIKK